MSDEASVRGGLQIRKIINNITVIDYSRNIGFKATVVGSKGPVPGAVTISTDGTDIDFSQLVTPGLATIKNMDSTNYVEYGIWEPATSLFYPIGEILPGEEYPIRFSRNLQEEYIGTGTGTSAPTNRLRFKANNAACVVMIGAFEA